MSALCVFLAASSLVMRSANVVRPVGNSVCRASPLLAAPTELGALSTKELKESLCTAALEFKTVQKARWEEEDAASEDAKFSLGREGDDVSVEQPDERFNSPLAAESLTNVDVAADGSLAALRNEVIIIIEELATRNPTPTPFAGWRGKDADSSPLDGTWRLLFTTAADATFRKTDSQGEADTYQEISAKRGHFVNCVDFSSETSKLRGFRVVVAGVPLSDNEVQLKFRRVKLLRRSRWLKSVVIPLPPSGLLRAFSRWASRGKGQLSNRGAGFQLLYLDDELRMHQTFDGQYFVQLRPTAYDAAVAQSPSPSAAVAPPSAASAGTRAGAPQMMGFADWGKGDKVATASHILVKTKEEAMAIKEKIEAGRVSFADAAEMFSTCGSASEGGSLGSFAPGEMVPAFDAYCFDPAAELGALGVVETEFGVHLILLEKQSLPAHVRKSNKERTYRMLDTPDPRTGLRG